MNTYNRFWRLPLALGTLFALLTSFSAIAQKRKQTRGTGAAPGQETFATPEEAASALVKAASSDDVPALLKLFGPDGEDLVSSADPVRDKGALKAFVAKADQKRKVTIAPKNPNRAILFVGSDLWPLPVPIVKDKGRWYFDTKAGRNEVL